MTRTVRAWLLPGLLSVLAGTVAAQQQPYALERMEMRAQLSPQRFTTLSAELGARIQRISVKEGERFKEGQVLIEFDCSLQSAQLDRAKAQLFAAENTWEGHKRLSEMNAVGQVELRNAEAEVRKARADVVYLERVLAKCTVAAPFGGRAAEQKVREQQFVQPGQPLLEIIDDGSLELEFIVPSRWLAWLKPGYAFQVRIDDTGRTYPVRLLRTAAKADPVSQSVKAVGVIDGHFPELIAGMSGRIVLAPGKQR